jgi:hypothetical protein
MLLIVGTGVAGGAVINKLLGALCPTDVVTTTGTLSVAAVVVGAPGIPVGTPTNS